MRTAAKPLDRQRDGDHNEAMAITEQEWLACSDPQSMLDFLDGKVSERKLRLAACGCARQILRMRKDGCGLDILSAAERYADRAAGSRDHLPAPQLVRDILQKAPLSRTRFTVSMLDATTTEDAWGALRETLRSAVCLVDDRRVLFDCLRDVLGNPFRPYPAPRSWPSTVVQLAESLYAGQDCAFALHDALLEAGHAELAEHFHEEKSHPKGCWVVDLVLGKT
jgi:hypothetical protein